MPLWGIAATGIGIVGTGIGYCVEKYTQTSKIFRQSQTYINHNDLESSSGDLKDLTNNARLETIKEETLSETSSLLVLGSQGEAQHNVLLMGNQGQGENDLDSLV